MEIISRGNSNLFVFLPPEIVIKEMISKRCKEIKNLFKNFDISDELLKDILEKTISKSWKQEVVNSCRPFLEEPLVEKINLYRRGKLIVIEIDEIYRKKVGKIVNCICSYVDEFTLDDYLKLRKFLEKLNLDSLSILDDSIILGIRMICTKKDVVFDMLNQFSKLDYIEWYPFSKLEWKNVSVISQSSGSPLKTNKRICERVYEEVNAMDIFFIYYEIFLCIEKMIKSYVDGFYDREFLLGYDKILEKINNEGVDDLISDIDNYFSVLFKNLLFRDIFDKLNSKKYYKGKLRSEIEIKVIKQLTELFKIKKFEKDKKQPINVYKSEQACLSFSLEAMSRKVGKPKIKTKKELDFYKQFHTRKRSKK